MPLHANCAISVPNNSTRLYPKTVPPYPTIVPNRTQKPYDRTTPYHETLPLYHTVSQSRTVPQNFIRRYLFVAGLCECPPKLDPDCTSLFGVRVRRTVLGNGFRGTVFRVRFWSTVLGYGTVQWYGRVFSIGTLPTLRKNTSFFWYIQ